MSRADAAVAGLVTALLDTWGDAATYTAPPAAPVSVRADVARIDEVTTMGPFDTAVRSPGYRIVVSQAEVPTRPRKGIDTITVAGEVYLIRDVAEDVERSIWTLDASPAPP